MTETPPNTFEAPGFRPGALARRWNRMRWIGAALTAATVLALYEPVAGQGLPGSRLVLAVSLPLALVAGNLWSALLARRGRLTGWGEVGLFIWDAAVVLAIVTVLAFGDNTVTGIILIFPVLGAAALWQLRGAMWCWAIMSALDAALRAIVSASGGPAAQPVEMVLRSILLLLIGLFVGTLVKEQTTLIQALRQAQSQLRQRAAHDDLTGLANRTTLQQGLDEAVARAERGGAAPALLFFDCDAFKVINDQLGHAAGDAALRMIAARLSAETRTGDLAARLSGDEFCVLLQTWETAVDADRLAQRLSHRISEPWQYDDATIELRASVGVTVWRPGTSGEQLLDAADQAMYRNKNADRTVRIRRTVHRA